MKLQFTKMSGAGNDFVVIDNRTRFVRNGEALARKLCDRRWGIGADGLLLVEQSATADFGMKYYNADGSYGGMCGNGGRCVARFAVDNGIAGPKQSFEALEFTYRAVVQPDTVALSMKDPVGLRTNLKIKVGSMLLNAYFTDTGSPHVVIPIQQLRRKYRTLDQIPLEILGAKIRNHRLLKPTGANVNFIDKMKDNSLRMRTYERGVEAETLACGTGSIASAVVAAIIWKLESPVMILASSGSRLAVGFKKQGSTFRNVTLTGPATVTFRGEIDVAEKEL